MKAVVCRRSGTPDVLTLEDIDRPSPTGRQVLVRVRAASVNPADFFQMTRAGRISGAIASRLKQKFSVVGIDFAGTVTAVGEGVTSVRPGDEVFGGVRGAFAEFVCLAHDGPMVRKPAKLSFEEAAAVPVAAVTALQALRDHGGLRPGQRVLINGASGGVGSFAVQLAKAFGGTVTAVCSAGNVDRARSLGADRVIDYAQDDFTRGDGRYDLIVDIAGNHSWAECRRVLTGNGRLVLVGGSSHTAYGGGATIRHLVAVRLASLRARKRVVFFIARLKTEDLKTLAQLLETGKIRVMIDRCYGLSQAADAFRYMGQGHAKGKIVVTTPV